MADPRLEAALAIARQRLCAISDGDTDAFEATQDGHEVACAALAPLAESGSEADAHALNELIALERQTLAGLQTLAAETGERMAVLRAGNRTNAAYRPVL